MSLPQQQPNSTNHSQPSDDFCFSNLERVATKWFEGIHVVDTTDKSFPTLRKLKFSKIGQVRDSNVPTEFSLCDLKRIHNHLCHGAKTAIEKCLCSAGRWSLSLVPLLNQVLQTNHAPSLRYLHRKL